MTAARRWLAALLLLGLAPFAAQAAELHGTVAEVVDADTVILAAPIDGARQVRLVGIQAPKLPLGRKGFVKWPLADEARAALETLVLGREVRLEPGTAPIDRHGRLLAHLYAADGTWVQGRLLADGWARVYTFADNRRHAAEMLAREHAARAARRGIWADPFYAVRDAGDVGRLQAEVGTFQLVEGRVVAAAAVGQRIFLNFARDWRSDFTVVVPKAAWPIFRSAGIDPISLEGRTVRVRGWLERWNGPMIELDHPERLEVFP